MTTVEPSGEGGLGQDAAREAKGCRKVTVGCRHQRTLYAELCWFINTKPEGARLNLLTKSTSLEYL